MDNENEELIEKLTELLNKPGGKQAARFALNLLGAIPFVGGIISGASSLWGEKEQQAFNEKITEWATNTNTDLTKVLKVLESDLREPTKVNLSLLLWEVLNAELPANYPTEGMLEVATILHGETRNEFTAYEDKGWITVTSNGNLTNMGAGNSVGNSIEDRKRPWGLGNGFIITFHKSLYED